MPQNEPHREQTVPTTKQKPNRREQDDPGQSKRFLEAARKAEADETEEGAKRAFDRVAASKKHRKT
jgi:hypothetical protein